MKKSNLKNIGNYLCWTAVVAFTVMLVLNVMVSLDFHKDKALPTLTLKDLGNVAYAMGGG